MLDFSLTVVNTCMMGTLYCLVELRRCFGGASDLHLHVRTLNQETCSLLVLVSRLAYSSTLQMGRYVSPNCRWTSTDQHGAITQK
jgi:hypothetical protein